MLNPDEKIAPLRKGLLELAILKVIAGRSVYAADILEKLSVTELATGEGTLYPLLSKLRRESLVEYEWAESSSGPPRKYYHLTAKGKLQLKELEQYWHHLTKTISGLGK